MAQVVPIFRVFVTSTFGDFDRERRALNDRVFLALRDYCERHGAQFLAIDLRWGVSVPDPRVAVASVGV